MSYFEGNGIRVSLTGTTTRIGERYVINLEISGDYGFVDDAKVYMNQQKGTNEREIKMNYISTENNMNLFSCEVSFNNVGLHYFCFKLIINRMPKWIKFDAKHGRACMTEKNIPFWSITVYENNYYVPEWAKGKVMYQIFPDRFYQSELYVPEEMSSRVIKKWGEMPDLAMEQGKKDDGANKIRNNDFFMGNLKGIEEKLDYLSELGVGIIYMNPIVRSQSNHRYDAANYEEVDPYLGTNEDLRSLCESAHKRGIAIVVDGVFNHTGNDSKYFNEFGTYDTVGAFQSTSSPYYSWYRKKPNGEFSYWWGFKNLPVCDGNDAAWQNYIYGVGGVIDKWFSLGIDGVRLDVADELTDSFVENIRNAVKRNKPDGFLIGEVWDNAVTKEAYGRQRTYMLGKGLDSVMNYPFTNAILKYVRFGKYEYLTETINEILTQYPKEAIFSLMNSLSTHDITRAITTLVGEGIQKNEFNWVWDVPYSRDWQYKHLHISQEKYELAKRMFKVATAIQYFLPGNPCIYYGDEVGMYGYRDPFNRQCFPWDNIDEELHQFFIELGKARNELEFLAKADLRICKATHDVFVFERFLETQSVLVAVNRSDKKVNFEIPEAYNNGEVLFGVNPENNVLDGYGITVIRR